MEEYTIAYEARPESSDLQVIENGLTEFDHTEFGRAGSQPFTFFLRDPQGSVVGGIHGNTVPAQHSK